MRVAGPGIQFLLATQGARGAFAQAIWSLTFLSEFCFHGIQHGLEIERFFKRLMGAEEFGDLKKISIALRAGHGNDFRIHVFPGQLQGCFQVRPLRA